MPIASQSPGAAILRRARHHLVSYIAPSREYSVARFVKDARCAIKAITRKGKLPIIVGGTGLYIKGLVDGLFPSPKEDKRFREKMQVYADRYGAAKLHDKLEKIDPVSSAKIHPNDVRRTIRALELYHATGRTMTDLKKETRGISSEYRIIMVGLTMERGELYKRIDERVDRMFSRGIVAEVRSLMKRDLSRTAEAVLGYKEISGYLNGEYDKLAAKEFLKMNTRRFAKRQLTWFRADPRIEWFGAGCADYKKVQKAVTTRV